MAESGGWYFVRGIANDGQRINGIHYLNNDMLRSLNLELERHAITHSIVKIDSAEFSDLKDLIPKCMLLRSGDGPEDHAQGWIDHAKVLSDLLRS